MSELDEAINRIRIESPIEADFLSAMKAVGGGLVMFIVEASLSDLRRRALADEYRESVFMSSQVTIGGYRCDFVLAAHNNAMYPRLVCVECDGAEFHSSPAQKDRDQERNRFLELNSVVTKRFTGKQIVRDPFKCASEALDAALGGSFITSRGVQTFGDAVGGALDKIAFNECLNVPRRKTWEDA